MNLFFLSRNDGEARGRTDFWWPNPFPARFGWNRLFAILARIQASTRTARPIVDAQDPSQAFQVIPRANASFSRRDGKRNLLPLIRSLLGKVIVPATVVAIDPRNTSALDTDKRAGSNKAVRHNLYSGAKYRCLVIGDALPVRTKDSGSAVTRFHQDRAEEGLLGLR